MAQLYSLRGLAILAIALGFSYTAQAGGYGRSYCNSCYVAPQRVVQPYNVTNVGNLNQFYTPAPYAQQYPITDAGFLSAKAEELSYQLQVATDGINQLRQQSQSRQFVLVVPQAQIQAYVEQTTETQHCVPGQQQPPTFSQQQKPSVLDVCLKCHGQNGKEREHFDLSGLITCDHREDAIEAYATGHMPPNAKTLPSPDQVTQFKLDLRELTKQRDEQAQPQQPTPPQDQPEPEGENAAPTEQPFSRITLPWKVAKK